jgi:hypothetical protein
MQTYNRSKGATHAKRKTFNLIMAFLLVILQIIANSSQLIQTSMKFKVVIIVSNSKQKVDDRSVLMLIRETSAQG